MVEVFITDLTKKKQVKKMVKLVQQLDAQWKVNFDMDETGLPFPNGHTVLRVEGESLNQENIMLTVSKLGFTCQIMEDEIVLN